MKYKAVVFDLWDTLVFWPTEDGFEVISRMADLVGVEPERFQEAWSAEYEHRWTSAFVPSVCAVCDRLGVSSEHAEAIVEIRSRHTREVLVPREGALDVLTALRDRGYALGLISNCSGDVAEAWSATALAPYFDDPVLSCSVGIAKPDRRIYEIAAERLGVTTSECLFVDDRPEFVEGAVAAGMNAVVLGEPPAEHLSDVLELVK